MKNIKSGYTGNILNIVAYRMALAMLLAMSISLAVICIKPAAAYEDMPIVDSSSYSVMDSNTLNEVFGKSSDTVIKARSMNRILILAGLHKIGDISSDDAESIVDIMTDEKGYDEKIKKLIKNEGEIFSNANRGLAEMGIQNSGVVSFAGTGDEDKATPRDIGKATSYLLQQNKIKELLKFSDIDKKSKSDGTGAVVLSSGKDESPYNLSVGNKKDSYFICVNVGGAAAQGSKADGNSLLTHALSVYRSYKVVSKGEKVDSIKIKGGRKSYGKVIAAEDLYITLPKEADDTIVKTSLDMKPNLVAPVKKGDEVGVLKAMEAGEVTASVKLILGEDVVKGGPWSRIGISDYMMVIGGGSITIIGIAVICIKRKRAKIRKKMELERQERIREQAMKIAMERAEKRRRNWPY